MWHEAAGRSDAPRGFAEVFDRLVERSVFVGHCLTVHPALRLVPDHTMSLRRLYAAFLALAVQDRDYASFREFPTSRQRGYKELAEGALDGSVDGCQAQTFSRWASSATCSRVSLPPLLPLSPAPWCP
jgi:hypothetical protein